MTMPERNAEQWLASRSATDYSDRSYYPAGYAPQNGWPLLFASEPKLAGALALIAERIGYDLDRVCRHAWYLLPQEWIKAGTSDRLAMIRTLLDDLIREDEDHCLDLVEGESISTIGD